MLTVNLNGIVYFNVTLPIEVDRQLNAGEIETIEKVVLSSVTRALNTEFNKHLKVTNIIMDNMSTTREITTTGRKGMKP